MSAGRGLTPEEAYARAFRSWATGLVTHEESFTQAFRRAVDDARTAALEEVTAAVQRACERGCPFWADATRSCVACEALRGVEGRASRGS